MVRRSARAAELCEGGCLEVRPKYGEDFTYCRMSIERARLAWRRHLSSGTDLNAIPTPEKQDVLTSPSSSIGAAMADVEEPVKGSPYSPAVAVVEEDGTIGNLVKVDVVERVGVRRRLYHLQEPCSAKWRRLPGSVSNAVVLVVELIDDAAVATLPCAGLNNQPRFNELTQELSNTRVEVVSLTARLDKVEGDRDDAMRQHEESVQ